MVPSSAAHSLSGRTRAHNALTIPAHCSLKGQPHIHLYGLRPLFLLGNIDTLAATEMTCYSNFKPMVPSFVQEMKAVLLEEKAKLERDLNQFVRKGTTADSDSDFPNLGDKEDENAAEVATYSDNLSLEEELKHQLKDVNAALKALDNNLWGICKYCKQEISEARLRARPTSSSCIECKKTLTQEV